jgi:GT2 family glycosyltransferase
MAKVALPPKTVETILVLQGEVDDGFEKYLRSRGRLEVSSVRGLSHARNIGIGLARGDFLLFLDDDAVLAEDSLQVLYRSVSEDRVSALCGKVVEIDTGEPYVPDWPEPKGDRLTWRNFQLFIGLCHVVHREAFDRCGLYDERLGVGSVYPAGEETDLFFRLLQRGESVRYVREMIVYHPSAKQFTLEKTFAYAFGNGALHAKYAWGLLPRHYWSFIRIILVNCVKIALGLCTRLWWDAVAWAKVTGNIRGYCEFIRREKVGCRHNNGVAW